MFRSVVGRHLWYHDDVLFSLGVNDVFWGPHGDCRICSYVSVGLFILFIFSNIINIEADPKGNNIALSLSLLF